MSFDKLRNAASRAAGFDIERWLRSVPAKSVVLVVGLGVFIVAVLLQEAIFAFGVALATFLLIWVIWHFQNPDFDD